MCLPFEPGGTTVYSWDQFLDPSLSVDTGLRVSIVTGAGDVLCTGSPVSLIYACL